MGDGLDFQLGKMAPMVPKPATLSQVASVPMFSAWSRAFMSVLLDDGAMNVPGVVS